MKTFPVRVALLAWCGSILCFAQSAATVVNYAGYTGTFPVAPGSIASVYGSFGNVTATPAPTLAPMPTELSGIRVRINNIDAPLYFVSSGQINIVVPHAVPTGTHTVEVASGANVIARGRVAVYEVGPGLYSGDTTPSRVGIVQNQDFAINAQSAPARRGEVIQIYATGCGAVTPALRDGVAPAVLSRTSAKVTVVIGAQEVTPDFAGAHPLYPGICQVNAVVPNHPSVLSGLVPIYIVVNGVPSNEVRVWVQ